MNAHGCAICGEKAMLRTHCCAMCVDAVQQLYSGHERLRIGGASAVPRAWSSSPFSWPKFLVQVPVQSLYSFLKVYLVGQNTRGHGRSRLVRQSRWQSLGGVAPRQAVEAVRRVGCASLARLAMPGSSAGRARARAVRRRRRGGWGSACHTGPHGATR